jgi:hypothetical protein
LKLPKLQKVGETSEKPKASIKLPKLKKIT